MKEPIEETVLAKLPKKPKKRSEGRKVNRERPKISTAACNCTEDEDSDSIGSESCDSSHYVSNIMVKERDNLSCHKEIADNRELSEPDLSQ